MVVTWVKKLVSGVALGCAATAMLASAASAQATFNYYDTAITEVYGSTYPLTGKLDLELFGDGTLRGHYHTTYYNLYVPVTGGRDGNYIWFDIGPTVDDLGLGVQPGSRLHVVATFNSDNSFRGQLYPEVSGADAGQYSNYMNAQGSQNQFLFAAKPTENPASGAIGDEGGGVRHVEIHDVRLDATEIALHSRELRKSLGQAAGVVMVVGKALDHRVEGHQTCRRQYFV